MLPWHEAYSCRELASGREQARISHRRGNRTGSDGTDTRDRLEPAADLARSMPSMNLLFDRSDPRMDVTNLPNQHQKALAGNRRDHVLTLVFLDQRDECLQTGPTELKRATRKLAT